MTFFFQPNTIGVILKHFLALSWLVPEFLKLQKAHPFILKVIHTAPMPTLFTSIVKLKSQDII